MNMSTGFGVRDSKNMRACEWIEEDRSSETGWRKNARSPPDLSDTALCPVV